MRQYPLIPVLDPRLARAQVDRPRYAQHEHAVLRQGAVVNDECLGNMHELLQYVDLQVRTCRDAPCMSAAERVAKALLPACGEGLCCSSDVAADAASSAQESQEWRPIHPQVKQSTPGLDSAVEFPTSSAIPQEEPHGDTLAWMECGMEHSVLKSTEQLVHAVASNVFCRHDGSGKVGRNKSCDCCNTAAYVHSRPSRSGDRTGPRMVGRLPMRQPRASMHETPSFLDGYVVTARKGVPVSARLRTRLPSAAGHEPLDSQEDDGETPTREGQLDAFSNTEYMYSKMAVAEAARSAGLRAVGAIVGSEPDAEAAVHAVAKPIGHTGGTEDERARAVGTFSRGVFWQSEPYTFVQPLSPPQQSRGDALSRSGALSEQSRDDFLGRNRTAPADWRDWLGMQEALLAAGQEAGDREAMVEAGHQLHDGEALTGSAETMEEVRRQTAAQEARALAERAQQFAVEEEEQGARCLAVVEQARLVLEEEEARRQALLEETRRLQAAEQQTFLRLAALEAQAQRHAQEQRRREIVQEANGRLSAEAERRRQVETDKVRSDTQRVKREVNTSTLQTLSETEALGPSQGALSHSEIMYEIVISRSPGQPLGFDICPRQSWLEVVSILTGGPVDAWNAQHKDRTVVPADKLFEVNGVQGDAHALLAELARHPVVKLRFRRVRSASPPVSAQREEVADTPFASDAFNAGENVQVEYDGEFYDARVDHVHSDATLTVTYVVDGTYEEHVPRNRLRSRGLVSRAPPSAKQVSEPVTPSASSSASPHLPSCLLRSSLAQDPVSPDIEVRSFLSIADSQLSSRPPGAASLRAVKFFGFKNPALNAFFVERPAEAFKVGGRETYWTEKGEYFLFYHAGLDVWAIDKARRLQHARRSKSTGIAHSPTGCQILSSSSQKGWLEWDTEQGKWFRTVDAGVVRRGKVKPLQCSAQASSGQLSVAGERTPLDSFFF